MENDPLTAVENQLADCKAKLASRKGKHEYRDNIPLLEAEIKRLESTRNMIVSAREVGNSATTEKDHDNG